MEIRDLTTEDVASGRLVGWVGWGDTEEVTQIELFLYQLETGMVVVLSRERGPWGGRRIKENLDAYSQKLASGDRVARDEEFFSTALGDSAWLIRKCIDVADWRDVARLIERNFCLSREVAFAWAA